MGCRKKGHLHTWPTRGTLTIQRCEMRCNFCTGDARYKDWKYAWFLRRHVRAIHVKKGRYKGMRVDAGWDDENPREGSNNGDGVSIKPEPMNSDDGEGVAQTDGELEVGPLPDFVTQPNFDNFDDEIYGELTSNLRGTHGSRPANPAYIITGATYGNVNAQFPTLAGEDPFGMDHDGINNVFQDWLTSTTGYDGSLDEPEQIEDEPIADTADQVNENGGELVDHAVPASSSSRFFMSDFSAPAPDVDDDEDDIPLAVRTESYNHIAHAPTDDAHNELMHALYGVSNTMHESGMNAQQMLPSMNLFVRKLYEEPDSSFPY